MDGLLLERLVGCEVVKVIRGEVGNGTTVGQFNLGASRTDDLS